MRIKFPDTPASILRLVLTPECNLHCIYCHNEGFDTEKNAFSALPMSEFKRILTLLKKNGVKSVCISGGEPLIAKAFPDVLKVVINIFGGEQVHVSTNGILLDDYLELMRNLGVSRINVSCDATDSIQYKRITGRDCFDRVVENIERAVTHNFFVNVNSVTLKGINTDKDYVYSMLDFWKDRGVRLSILRLCFAFDSMNEYRYDINELIDLFNSDGMESYLPPHNNRPPTLCYKYHDLEVALRYYVPDRSNYPCNECHKRELCSEGLYHPRLGLNGVLRSCILREDLSLDLTSEGAFDAPLSRFLKLFDPIPETWAPATCDTP